MAILALVIAAVFAALFFAAKKAPHPCRLLAPSALAVCACAVCLSATTYAWFSATSTSQVATIQAAEYNVSVAMNANGAWDGNGTYSVSLDAGTTYVVRLTATGNATKGYCIVTLGGETGYTPEILTAAGNNTFTFVIGERSGALTITPKWGELPTGTTENPIDIISGVDPSLLTAMLTPEPPETPEIPPVEPTPETPENPDNTYLVEDDTAVTTQE